MDMGESIKVYLWKFVMILILTVNKIIRKTKITSAFRVGV